MQNYDTWSWVQTYSSAPGWLVVLFSLLLILTLILWIFLPFAIYGVKTILRQQNASLAESQRLLSELLAEVRSRGSRVPESSDEPPPDEPPPDADSKKYQPPES